MKKQTIAALAAISVPIIVLAIALCPAFMLVFAFLLLALLAYMTYRATLWLVENWGSFKEFLKDMWGRN